jgi:hypothetical protein
MRSLGEDRIELAQLAHQALGRESRHLSIAVSIGRDDHAHALTLGVELDHDVVRIGIDSG